MKLYAVARPGRDPYYWRVEVAERMARREARRQRRKRLLLASVAAGPLLVAAGAAVPPGVARVVALTLAQTCVLLLGVVACWALWRAAEEE